MLAIGSRTGKKARAGGFSMRCMLAAAVLMAAPVISSAKAWPERPVTLVVGFTPGGGADLVARVVGSALGKELGQSVVVENRPGAGSSIAAGYVARSAPDGYTVLIASPSAIQVNPLLMPKLGYSPSRDLVPVTQLVESPLVIAVNPALGVHTLKELIDLARSKPGKLSFASSGVGSASHLAGEEFEEVTGVKLLHVPYKGGAAATASVVSGETDISFASPPSIMGFLKSKHLMGLAVTSPDPVPTLPNLPGMKAVGLPNYKLPVWYGMFVPAGTPAAVQEKLLQAAKAAVSKPDVIEALSREANVPVTSSSPAEFASFVRAEQPFWADLVKKANVKAE